MVDEVDRVTEDIERELQLRIDACRGVSQSHSLYRLTCQDCDEPLPDHRRPMGRCVPCQEKRELRQRTQAVGI